jgi:hypothetical protein
VNIILTDPPSGPCLPIARGDGNYTLLYQLAQLTGGSVTQVHNQYTQISKAMTALGAATVGGSTFLSWGTDNGNVNPPPSFYYGTSTTNMAVNIVDSECSRQCPISVYIAVGFTCLTLTFSNRTTKIVCEPPITDDLRTFILNSFTQPGIDGFTMIDITSVSLRTRLYAPHLCRYPTTRTALAALWSRRKRLIGRKCSRPPRTSCRTIKSMIICSVSGVDR